jgi:hypothetical protein
LTQLPCGTRQFAIGEPWRLGERSLLIRHLDQVIFPRFDPIRKGIQERSDLITP